MTLIQERNGLIQEINDWSINKIEPLTEEEVKGFGYVQTGYLQIFSEEILQALEERGVDFFKKHTPPHVDNWRYQSPEDEDLLSIKDRINCLVLGKEWKIDQSHPEAAEILAQLNELAKTSYGTRKGKSITSLQAYAYYCFGNFQRARDLFLENKEYSSAFAILYQCGLYEDARKLLTSRSILTTILPIVAPYVVMASISQMAKNGNMRNLTTLNPVPPTRIPVYNALMKACLLLLNGNYDEKIDRLPNDIDAFHALQKEIAKANGKRAQNGFQDVFFYMNGEEANKREKAEKEKILENKKFRPGKESPYKLAHHIWANEGSPEEAIPYYQKAIDTMDTPASASADLVYLYAELHRWEDSAHVLTEYGSKYMDPGKYERILCAMRDQHPEMRELLPDPTEKGIPDEDYYQTAVQAFMVEHDLATAVEYYQKAIAANQNVSPSIKSLIQIYVRLDQTEKGFELLKTPASRVLNERELLEAKRTLLLKTKNKEYLKETKQVFSKLLQYPLEMHTKLFNYDQQAKILLRNGFVKDALEVFQEELEFMTKSFSKKEFLTNESVQFCYIGMARCYAELGEKDKVKECANKVLSINPANEAALKLLGGAKDSEKAELDENLEKWDYFEEKVDEAESLDDGDYPFEKEQTPTKQTIQSWYKKRIKETKGSYEKKGKIAFRAANLLRTYAKDDEEVYRETIQDAVGFFVRQKLESGQDNELEAARYGINYLLQNLKLTDADKKNWSLVYFASLLEQPSDCLKILDSPLGFSKVPDILEKAKSSFQLSPFLGESFLLIEGLGNREIRDNLLKDIYAWKSYADRVYGELAHLVGIKEKEETTSEFANIKEDAFLSVYAQASDVFKQKREDYRIAFNDCLNDFSNKTDMRHHLFGVFEKNNYIDYCDESDREIHGNIKKGLEFLNEYRSAATYISQLDKLNKARNRFETAANRIYENPTNYASEILTIIQRFLASGFEEEAKSFFLGTRPEISVEITPDSVFLSKEEGLLRLSLQFLNQEGKQTAEEISLQIESDQITDFDYQKEGLFFDGDGKKKEVSIACHMKEGSLNEGTLSLKIKAEGRYRIDFKNFQSSTLCETTLQSQFNDQAEFEPIEKNPYNDKKIPKEDMFVGREKMEADLTNLVEAFDPNEKMGFGVAVWGQQRSGKTTIIDFLKQNCLKNPNYIFVYIDVRGYSGKNLFLHFADKLIEGVFDVVKTNPSLYDALKNTAFWRKEAAVYEDFSEIPGEDGQIRSDAFIPPFLKVLQRENEKGHSYRLIIAIDEFSSIYEKISDPNTMDFLYYLKNFVTNNPIFVLVAAHDHFYRLKKDYPNELTFFKKDFEVSYLEKKDAIELMSKAFFLKDKEGNFILDENGERKTRYCSGVRERLFEETAGSAFVITLVCKHLVKYVNQKRLVRISLTDLDDAIKELFDSDENFEETAFHPLYGDLTEGPRSQLWSDNKKILRSIAELCYHGHGWASTTDIGGSDKNKRLLDALVRRKVVERPDPDRCRIRMQLYQHYLEWKKDF